MIFLLKYLWVFYKMIHILYAQEISSIFQSRLARGGHKGGQPFFLECCYYFLEFWFIFLEVCSIFLQFSSSSLRFVPNSWKSFVPKNSRPPLAEILRPPLKIITSSLFQKYISIEFDLLWNMTVTFMGPDLREIFI